MLFCALKNVRITKSLLFIVSVIFWLEKATTASDDELRPKIQAALKVFANLQNCGKTSLIAIDTHPTLASKAVPFNIFAADYDPSRQDDFSKFTNRLKLFDANSQTTNVFPVDNIFTSINSLDYRIASLDGSATNPGTLINQYAVSVRPGPLLDKNNTLLIDTNNVIQPIQGNINPTALLQAMFAGTGWKNNNDNGINRLLSLTQHLSNFPSRGRIFVRSDKILMLNGSAKFSDAIKPGAFTSANWTDLKLASQTSYNPNNTWLDLAPYDPGTPFLWGKPLIFNKQVLAITGSGKIKIVTPFCVDVAGQAASYATNVTAPTDPLQYVDKSTNALVTPTLLQQRWITGQVTVPEANAFSIASLVAMAAYDDGMVFLINSGNNSVSVAKCSLASADLISGVTINAPANILSLPNSAGAKYVDVRAAGSDSNKLADGSLVVYLALLRADGLLDVAKITTSSTSADNKSISLITVPVYVCSLSIDRNGHLAFVDSLLHEVWWGSVDRLFDPSFSFDYSNSNVFSQQAILNPDVIALQSDIAAITASLNDLQAQADAIRSQIANKAANAASLQLALASLTDQISTDIGNLNANLTKLQTLSSNNQKSLADITTQRNNLMSQQQALATAHTNDLKTCDEGINNLLATLGPIIGVAQSGAQIDKGSDPNAFCSRVETFMTQVTNFISAKNATLASMQKAATDPNATAQQSKDFITQQQNMIALLGQVSSLYQQEMSRIQLVMNDPSTTADMLTTLSNTLKDLQTKQAAVLDAQTKLSDGITNYVVKMQENAIAQATKLAAQVSSAAEIQAQLDTLTQKQADATTLIGEQAAQIQALLAAKQASTDTIGQAVASLQKAFSSLQTTDSKLQVIGVALSAALDNYSTNQSNLKADLTDFSNKLGGVFSAAGVDAGVSTAVQKQINDTVTNLNNTITQQGALIDALKKDRDSAMSNIQTMLNSTNALPDNANDIASTGTQYTSAIEAKFNALKNILQKQIDDVTAQLATLQPKIDQLNNMQQQATSSQTQMPQAPGQTDLSTQLQTLQTQKDALTKQKTDLQKRLSDAQTAHDQEANQQKSFVEQYNQAAAALTAAMNTTATNQTDLAAMVAKLQLVVSAKDKMIKVLGTQVANLQKDIADKNAQIATLQSETSSKSDQIAKLQADVAAKTTQMATLQIDHQKEIADKNTQITTLQTTENTIRTKVQALLANQTASSGTLSDAQKAALTGASLTDLVPMLTSLVDTKNTLIASLQADLKKANASNDQLTAANQTLQASLDQQKKDNEALTATQAKLSQQILAQANIKIDGTTDVGTIDFDSNADLMQQFKDLMDLRNQQIAQLQKNAKIQADACTNQINNLANQLNSAQTQAAGLQATTVAQNQQIINLTNQLADLKNQLTTANQNLADAQTARVQNQQTMQATIDALNNQAKQLNATIAQKQATIDSQTATIAEKDKAIAEQKALTNAYATSTAHLQDLNNQLADQLAKTKADLAAQALILQKTQGDLSLSQQQVADLTAKLQAVLEQKKVTDAAYEARIKALEDLNAQNQKTIQDLQQKQTVLTSQVNTLANIVDKHQSDLTSDDKAQLQKILGTMSSDEAALVSAMLDGTLDITQLDPYCVLWFSQVYQYLVNNYVNEDATQPDASLTALEKAASKDTTNNYVATSGIAARINDLIQVHTLLYGLKNDPTKNITFAQSYAQLTSDQQALVQKYVSDIQNQITTATASSSDSAAQFKSFKGAISSKIYLWLKDPMILSELKLWNNNTYNPSSKESKKGDLLTALTGSPSDLKVAMVQVKISAAFTQQQAQMQAQQANSDAAVQRLQDQADIAKTALAQALATNDKNVAEAQATLKKVQDDLNQKLADQQKLLDDMAELFKKATAGAAITTKFLQRQTTQDTQATLLSFYQGRISELTAQQNALNLLVAKNAGDPTKTKAALNQVMEELARLQYDMQYMPYVLPLALKITTDENKTTKVVKYARTFDINSLATLSGPNYYTETGTEELGVVENIVVGWIDKAGGLAHYLDTTTIDTNGFAYLGGNNRFAGETVKVQAVNRGDNSVSFECIKDGKRYILALQMLSEVPTPPAGLSDEDKKAFVGNSHLYDVKFVPYPTDGKIDEKIDDKTGAVLESKKFYVEGIDQPAYAEAVILRACSTANDFASDMHGYLSVQEDKPGSGNFKLIYKPYVSPSYHAMQGNEETTFMVSRIDAASHSDEATLIAGLATIDQKDKTKVLDANTGYTEYDQEMAKLLQPLITAMPTIVNNNYKFEDLALTIAEFIAYRQSKGLLMQKDFGQFKTLAQALSRNIVTSQAGTSNLATNSAGYKALYGSVDNQGKPVAGTGALGQAATGATVVSIALGEGDLVSFASGNSCLCFNNEAGSATSRPVTLNIASIFDTKANFVLKKDTTTAKYRLYAYPSFGDYKMSVDNAGAISFVPLSNTTGNDIFDLVNLQAAKPTEYALVSLDSTGKSTGYLKVVNNALTFATLAAGATPDFAFTLSNIKSGTFRAKLVALAGQPADSSGIKLSDLAVAEIARDNTLLNSVLTDVATYAQAFVTDSNKAAFEPVIETFAGAMRGGPLAKNIDPVLLSKLEGSFALFRLNQAQYFLLRDKDGYVLINQGVFKDTTATMPSKDSTGNTTQEKVIYSDFEFTKSVPFNRLAVMRIIPHPTQAGTFLINAYLGESGLPVYLQAKNVTVTDSNNNTINLSAVTGSDAASYDTTKSISPNANELFAISGTMNGINIRSTVPTDSMVGFAVSAVDQAYTSIIQNQIADKKKEIETVSDTITGLNGQITQAASDLTTAQTALNNISNDISKYNQQVTDLAKKLSELKSQGKTDTDPEVKSNADLTATVNHSLDAAMASQKDAQKKVADVVTNQTSLQQKLEDQKVQLTTKQNELSALNSSLNFKRLQILSTKLDNTMSSTFTVEPLSSERVTLMLADVNQLPDTLYNLLANIEQGTDPYTNLDTAGKTAAADRALKAFMEVLYTDATNTTVKPYLLSKNIKSITTDDSKGIYNMADTLDDITTDFKYEPRKKTGILFSDTANAMLTQLKTLFIIPDLMAMNDENLKRIQTFGDQDLMAALVQNQTDKVKLRNMLTPLLNFVFKQNIIWADASGNALSDDALANNTTDLSVSGLAGLALRTDLSDSAKGVLAYKLNTLLAAATITDQALQALLTSILLKIQPTAAIGTSKPTSYSSMSVYDRLDLAENMLNGRYKDLSGKLILSKNSTEAANVLNTITDADLAKEPDAEGFKAWKIQLMALTGINQTVATEVAAQPQLQQLKLGLSFKKKSGSKTITGGPSGNLFGVGGSTVTTPSNTPAATTSGGTGGIE